MRRLLYATGDGQLRTHRSLEALGQSGRDIDPPDQMIPLPPAASLMHLPGRRPLGKTRSGETVELDDPEAVAVAAVLPPGYLRTWLPAYVEDDGASVLPLYGYAAVADVDGEPQVAALPTDLWEAWNPLAGDRRKIPAAIRAARRALPGNRLVQHLERCATEYRCLTAQNIFLGRGEGAIPVSPACNAACLGCISEQWGDVDSPQDRLGFAPNPEEIAELAAWHLRTPSPTRPTAGRETPENFVSFGQGCEGEALTRGAALVEATRRIRAAAPSATIHINTNGSRPNVLRRLVDAGLNSIRISIFSLRDPYFRAYYRPIGYGLEQVAECAEIVGRAGGQVTINLLTFPGVTDAAEEIDLLTDFIGRFGVHQVQLRSLNVDPHWLLRRIPDVSGAIGMRRFVSVLSERCPGLRLGNFTRPWPVIESQPAWASFK